MSTHRPLDDNAKAETLSWLSARSELDLSTGFDATGWARSTWVLHSIYEDPSADYEATHDDLHRQRVAAGLERPTVVNGVDLDASPSVVGCGGSISMLAMISRACASRALSMAIRSAFGSIRTDSVARTTGRGSGEAASFGWSVCLRWLTAAMSIL